MLQLRPTSGKKNLISSKTSSKVREKSNSQINKSWRSLLSLTCPTRYAQWSPTSRNERILYSNSKPYGGIKISVNIFRSRETYQGAILEELHLKSFNYNWTDLGNKTVVVQLLSCVHLFGTPWTAAQQASLSTTNSRSFLKLMSTELMMPSNYLILCYPLLLLPSIFPSIRVFSNGEGNGNPLQYSCLENLMKEEPGRLQSMGSKELDTT